MSGVPNFVIKNAKFCDLFATQGHRIFRDTGDGMTAEINRKKALLAAARAEIYVVPRTDTRKVFADPEPSFAEVVTAFGINAKAVDPHT